MQHHVSQAYDQQQLGLVDAASKALSYRQNVLEENIRLTYSLQVSFSLRYYIVLSFGIVTSGFLSCITVKYTGFLAIAGHI